MAATVTRGYTFASTELCTNTKLHTLVDSATIANIDVTNFASGSGLVIRSTSAPSDTDSLWVDTNMTPPVLKLYTGSEWQGAGPYGVFTNKSGSQRTAGEVVVVDTTTDGSFTTTTTADDPKVLGVVMETIANNADGVIALPGARITSILTAATTARGDRLSTSTTAGKCTPGGVNCFAVALGTTTGAGTLGEAILIGTSTVPTTGGTSGQFLKTLGAGANPAWAFAFAQNKLVSTTRDISLTTQWAVTGVGFTPKEVTCFWAVDTGGQLGIGHADSAKSGGAIGCVTTNDTSKIGAGIAVFATSNTVYNLMTVTSYDADGATFDFAKTGSPTGTATVYFLFRG